MAGSGGLDLPVGVPVSQSGSPASSTTSLAHSVDDSSGDRMEPVDSPAPRLASFSYLLEPLESQGNHGDSSSISGLLGGGNREDVGATLPADGTQALPGPDQDGFGPGRVQSIREARLTSLAMPVDIPEPEADEPNEDSTSAQVPTSEPEVADVSAPQSSARGAGDTEPRQEVALEPTPDMPRVLTEETRPREGGAADIQGFEGRETRGAEAAAKAASKPKFMRSVSWAVEPSRSQEADMNNPVCDGSQPKRQSSWAYSSRGAAPYGLPQVREQQESRTINIGWERKRPYNTL